MTQRELADLLEYGEPAISDLVNKDKGSKRLKKLALGELKKRAQASHSEVDPTSPSEVSGLEVKEQHGEYLTAEEWKQRATAAEMEIERLKTAIRILAAPKSVSSKLPDAEQAIYDEALGQILNPPKKS